MLPYGAVRFKALTQCSHLKWQRSVPMKCRSNFVSELQILMCLFLWMVLVVIWEKSFWVPGNVNLVKCNLLDSLQSKAACRGWSIAVCLLSAWKDHYYIANHLHEKGKLLKPWKIAPEWENPGLLKPLLGHALGQAHFLKDTRREGKAILLKKEHNVSKCRNKMAATKWSNFVHNASLSQAI